MSNTKSMRTAFALLLSFLAAQTTQAYELHTHAAITWVAFNQSALSQQQLQDQLDITPLLLAANRPFSQIGADGSTQTDKPFGTSFWDVSGLTVNLRLPSTQFEGGIISRVTSRAVKLATLSGWVMQGAIREDDGAGSPFVADDEPTSPPEGDAFGEINRYCNHFFDPYHRSSSLSGALTDGPPCLQGGFSGASPLANPDWAIGVGDAFATPPAPSGSRRNHFSVQDLYESIWRATTGTTFPSLSKIDVPNGLTAEAVRMGYWATAFRTLGHVLHLNEDMAQPQHTRNEVHGGGPFDAGGHKSQMENFAEAAVLGSLGLDVPDKDLLDWTSAPMVPIQPKPLVFSGYSIPSFPRLSEFWSSGPGEASHLGYGMADYSNHGFFTPANNIGDKKQPYPVLDPTKDTWSSVLVKDAGLPTEVHAQYLMGVVHDNLTNSDSPVLKRSRYSIFSPIPFYNYQQPPMAYTIDTAIYADEASELIKRSTAYAAGIINHIFRGQLEIGKPAQGAYAAADQLANVGFQRIRLTVKNTTADIVTPQGATVAQDMAHGTLMLIVKFHRNNCYTSDLSGEYGSPGKTIQSCRNDQDEIVTSNVDYSSGVLSDISLAAGADAREYTFLLADPLPLSATDVRFQVAFRGQVGADADVVAIATKDVPEPSFYSYINPTDSLVCISGSWYKRNADGTMPVDLVNAGYNFPPQTLPHVALSFRQNAIKPYATLDGAFAHPLAYPLVAVDDLAPGHFFRVAVIAEDGIPWGTESLGFSGADTRSWEAATNAAVFSLDTGSGTSSTTPIKVKSFAAQMTPWQGVNTFRFGFTYIYAGTSNCNTQEPRDMMSADGKVFPDRIQVPVSILDTN